MRFGKRSDDGADKPSGFGVARGPHEPAEILWAELEDWFREEDGSSHPGPDLGFSGLELTEAEGVWRFLAVRADPLDPAQTAWDDVDQASVSVAALLERGVVAATARCPTLRVRVDGITSHGVRLPWLGVFLYPSQVAVYWWVGDDTGWNPKTVAGLAVLLGDLRSLVPKAQLDLEWGGGDKFWAAVDDYLAAGVHPLR